MCGRFSQSMTREEYLSLLANEADRNIAYDPAPIGRYKGFAWKTENIPR